MPAIRTLRRTTKLAASLVVIAALVVPFAAARSGANSGQLVTRVTVKISDTGVTVSAKTVPAGTVSFLVKNVGKQSHAFRVGGKATPVLAPGRSATLVVHFVKGGNYTYQVTLYRGRSGTLTVTIPKSGSAGSTQIAAGKAVFKSAGCGKCHVLKAAGTQGTAGPNLDKLKLSLAKIVTQVTSGGRFMPPFGASAGGSLSATQIKNLAAFVFAAERS